jgi:hypothetical protein
VRRAVLLVSGSLFVVLGVAWPLFDVVRGPVLWDFGDHHGIDAGDFIAVPLVLLAVLLLRRARVLHRRVGEIDASSK